VFSACGAASEKDRASAFAASLVALDSIISTRPTSEFEKAFSRAIHHARQSSEWLSLLKRARAATAAGEAGRYVRTADLARKAFPESEPIAAAAALAYARGGRPADALALFEGTLSPEARPSLWAEAFIASRGSGGPAIGGAVVAKGADYARLAEISGDPRAFLGAAAAALEAGDKASARAWLEKGLAGGAEAPIELLWDCGLFELLAQRQDLYAGSEELALMGDAAWMTGDSSLARRRWERSISLSPRRSWKPYSKLALMSNDNGEAAASYWARLRAAFLSGPASPARDGALGAYAAQLAREGRDGDALAILADGSELGAGALAVLASTIKGRSQPEGRFAADLERLAAERSDDPEVLGAVLRALALRGMYGEVALLREGARRKVAIEHGWYYDAVVLAARGDFPGAVKVIEAAGDSGAADASASAKEYALGSLFAAMGYTPKSVEAFSRAAASGHGGRERCAALKALGSVLGESGDLKGAAEAYGSAAVADPSDAEAAVLARGVSHNNVSEAAH
jgi:tetratricopeptide (TPR) repeat protein